MKKLSEKALSQRHNEEYKKELKNRDIYIPNATDVEKKEKSIIDKYEAFIVADEKINNMIIKHIMKNINNEEIVEYYDAVVKMKIKSWKEIERRIKEIKNYKNMTKVELTEELKTIIDTDTTDYIKALIEEK